MVDDLIEFKALPDTSTPLNPTNINYNFKKLNNPIGIYECRLNEDFIAQPNEYNFIPFSKIKTDNNFFINKNGKIVVNNDCDLIINTTIQTNSNNSYTLRLCVNDDTINQFDRASTTTINGSFITSVKKNDEISLFLHGYNNFTIRNIGMTWLQIGFLK